MPPEKEVSGDEASDASWESMSEGSDSDMIEVLREELREAPIGHPFRTELLRALGDTLFDRHLQTESMDDLDEATDLGRQVVASVTEPQERAEALIHLGIRLGERYSTTGEQADFDEAQRILHQAHNLSDDAGQGESWYNLGLLYKFRYGKTRDPADLDEAIRLFRLAADVTPPHHPLWAACLNNLGNALEARYMISNKQEDLSEAIELARKVLKTVSDDHPTYPKVLVNLGNWLNLEYSRTAVAETLDEAIQLFTQALHVIPDEEPHRAYVLSILGQCLGQRALTHDGTVTDLDEGIRLCREAVDITADENPEKVAYLNNLGNLLGDIYLFKTGAVADLNDSIQCLRQAVNTEPQDNDEMVICCSNLAAQLNERYSRTGALADLEEAIELQRKVVKNTSKTHANYVLYLTNLGIFLSNLHSRTKKSHVLEEAISVIEQACDGTPENGSARIAQFNQLAILRGRKYADTRKISDLEAAIQAGRDAVAPAPRGHPSLGTVFNNLGDDLGNLYLRTRDITHLEEGLTYLQQAFEILPAESPDRSALLGNLGDQLMHRYKAKSTVEDRRRALDYYQEALRLESASLLSRIYAGRAILDAIIDTRNQDTASADPSEWELAYEAANTAVNLIPRLSSRSLRNADRKHALSQNQVVGLASDAAAVALQTGKSPLEALRLLEQGRGVLGASLEQMRAEIQSLRAVDPDLADRFVRLREELDAGETSQLQRPLDVEDQGVQGPKTSPPRALTTRRSKVSKEFDELLARIQGLPGFEDFLRPLGEEDIREAARYGPVVVVNISRFRCDALLVDTAHVRAVPLVGLSKENIQNRAKQDDKLRSYQTLEWLWDVVAKPVLDALGYTQPVPASGDDSDTAMPHIWWIPTGPLTKLPLHAAGYHETRSGTTVLDRVMSSYASSIKALVRIRQRPSQSPTNNSLNIIQALLVAIEYTPGGAYPPLPFAADEISVVKRLCTAMGMQPITPGQRKQDITPHLRTCSIFHFAGHGATDPYDAANSRLILLPDSDGGGDSNSALPVSELLDMDLLSSSSSSSSSSSTTTTTTTTSNSQQEEKEPGLGLPPHFLAFLSACGTGRVRDNLAVDESIHLASAFQLAGFRHVVGTLWEVLDDVCVTVARLVYEGLRAEWELQQQIHHGGGGLEDLSVCKALHGALKALRDGDVEGRGLVGGQVRKRNRDGEKRDVVLVEEEEEEEEERVAVWAPYVHFGV